jgi:hypothetical protein
MIRSILIVFVGLVSLVGCDDLPATEERPEAPLVLPDRVPANGFPSERSATLSDRRPGDAAAARDLIREFRAARNDKIDALYLEYGKGEWRELGERVVEHTLSETTRTLTQNASKTEKVLVDEMMGLIDEAADNALADLERDVFSTYVTEVGQGQRASALDEHTRGFFSSKDVQARCRDIAAIGDKISELEALVMKDRVFSRP